MGPRETTSTPSSGYPIVNTGRPTSQPPQYIPGPPREEDPFGGQGDSLLEFIAQWQNPSDVPSNQNTRSGTRSGNDQSMQQTINALLQLASSDLNRPIMPQEPSFANYAIDPSMFAVTRDTALDDRINDAEQVDLARAAEAYAGMPEYNQNNFASMEFRDMPSPDDSLLALLASQGGDVGAFEAERAALQGEGQTIANNWEGFRAANEANVRTDQDAYRRDQAFNQRAAEDFIRGSAFGMRGAADMRHSNRVMQMEEARRAAEMDARQRYQGDVRNQSEMERQLKDRHREQIVDLLRQIIGMGGGAKLPDLNALLGGIY